MPSPYTTAGFYHTPVSKVLIGSSILSYIVVTFPLNQYRHLFIYNVNRVLMLSEIWRLVTGKLVFLDAKDMLLGVMLFYNFRMFERRYGSRKFCSYILATGMLSTGLELLMVYICRRLNLDIAVMPSGPLCVIYPLFVPHFCDLPRVAVAHLWGIPITGKSITYIIGLQLASGSVESFMIAACGVIAGLMYRSNFLRIPSLIFIPKFVSNIFGSAVGNLLDSPPPRITEVSQGATLDIQRLQQTERLEQQILWNQLRQPRRPRWGFNFGLPFQNHNRPPQIFHNRVNRPPQNHYHAQGDNNLHRRSNTVTHPQASTSQASASSQNAENVSEEQVSRLCEMGFNRDKVLQALHVSNNDISTATTFLLQEL